MRIPAAAVCASALSHTDETYTDVRRTGEAELDIAERHALRCRFRATLATVVSPRPLEVDVVGVQADGQMLVVSATGEPEQPVTRAMDFMLRTIRPLRTER